MAQNYKSLEDFAAAISECQIGYYEMQIDRAENAINHFQEKLYTADFYHFSPIKLKELKRQVRQVIDIYHIAKLQDSYTTPPACLPEHNAVRIWTRYKCAINRALEDFNRFKEHIDAQLENPVKQLAEWGFFELDDIRRLDRERQKQIAWLLVGGTTEANKMGIHTKGLQPIKGFIINDIGFPSTLQKRLIAEREEKISLGEVKKMIEELCDLGNDGIKSYTVERVKFDTLKTARAMLKKPI